MATEFDKIEITGDLDERNCGDMIGMEMNWRENRGQELDSVSLDATFKEFQMNGNREIWQVKVVVDSKEVLKIWVTL